MSLNKREIVTFSNISATPASFSLEGGFYGMQASATWGGGSVTLNRLSNDGSTWVSTGTSFLANGFTTAYLMSGTYQVAIATATAVYAEIISIVTTP